MKDIIRYVRFGTTRNVVETREVPSARLTGECWSVQFRGLIACDKCELRDTKSCGGKKIRKTGMNELGFRVPLGDRTEAAK